MITTNANIHNNYKFILACMCVCRYLRNYSYLQKLGIFFAIVSIFLSIFIKLLMDFFQLSQSRDFFKQDAETLEN